MGSMVESERFTMKRRFQNGSAFGQAALWINSIYRYCILSAYSLFLQFFCMKKPMKWATTNLNFYSES